MLFPEKPFECITNRYLSWLITGSQAQEYLERLSTNNLSSTQVTEHYFLKPDSRIIARALIMPHTDGWIAWTEQEQKTAFIDHLEAFHFGENIQWHAQTGYSLRISTPEEMHRLDSPLSCNFSLTQEQPDHNRQDWNLLNLTSGRASWSSLEKNNPLFMEIAPLTSFIDGKGCYPGQEVVARILHQGRVRRVLVSLMLDQKPQEELSQEGNPITVFDVIELPERYYMTAMLPTHLLAEAGSTISFEHGISGTILNYPQDSRLEKDPK